ncbi:Peptidyl-prolyl cis-trans isomerase [hydrothermal vent metagenome]|uniref:peptidylprolyl isomerase n=1 Tax=hydrothermal vent metagenome TaxID=652676 RepID=A0A3B1BTH0_9ZZZZ
MPALIELHFLILRIEIIMKTLLKIFLSAMLIASLIPATNSVASENAAVKKKGKKVEEIAIIDTRHGKIKLRFFPDVAPGHVENFKKLAKSGFYDGTTFHRVIPGFMIQGGDTLSKDASNKALHGTGGPGYTIDAEFSNKPHKRGTLSMARSQNPNSAGSQFFICVADASFLDGQYTVFGEVIDGLDVVDKIVAEKRDARDNPVERVEMKVTIEEE